jgi:hypothetical protein
MRRSPIVLVNNVQLPNAVAAQFTMPAGSAPGVAVPAASTATITAATFNNTSGAAVTVDAHLVPAAGAAANSNKVASFSVPAGAPRIAYELIGQHLQPGWSLQMVASAATSVTAAVSGVLTEL